MVKDDLSDKDFKKLDEEIESKVEALFVDTEEPQTEESAQAPPAEETKESPLKPLTELFLTLEWEINQDILANIKEEVERLESGLHQNPAAVEILQMMEKVLADMLASEEEVAREPVNFLQRAKEGLERVVPSEGIDEDELSRIVADIKESFDSLAKEEEVEEEAPIIGEKEMKELEEIERVVEESLQPEQMAEKAAPEFEEAAPSEEDEFEACKASLSDQGAILKGLIDRFMPGEMIERNRELLTGMEEQLGSIKKELLRFFQQYEKDIARLQGISLAPKVEEKQVAEEASEELIFVSVSDRIFGFPEKAVQAVFKVPEATMKKLSTLEKVRLNEQDYPLVPMWKRLGLKRPARSSQQDGRRILVVRGKDGDKAILVDAILARQEAHIRQVSQEEAEEGPFKAVAVVEKGAFIFDLDLI